MNPNKICFILCVNNDVFAHECINYINCLKKPDKFSIDILTIHDAPSMLSGYREGCASTDAFYMVFMHQDVFILNRYFIYDIINIFENDNSIGIIGMTGVTSLPENFIMWSGQTVGNLYTGGVPADYSNYRYDPIIDGYDEVEAVDGLLIATRGTPILRDNIFDGWDFYDVSISMEARLKGQRIVVPRQKSPWCLHDDGNILSMLDYDYYRQLAINEYR